MLAMERFFCKVCGSKDMELHRERFCKCKSCESVFTYTIVEKYNKGIVDEVKQALREHELEKLSMLKERRWALMHVKKNGEWHIAKNADLEELKRIGEEIVRFAPADFLSEFYALFSKKAKNGFSRFVQQRFKEKAITPEHEDYGFLPDVLEYLAVAAPLEWLDEAKQLALRASFPRSYVAKLDERRDKLHSGIYNPSLPRQIFIAYSSKDLELALRLCDELEQQGLKCYISHRNMDNSAKSTADYRYALQTAIDNCQLFLFVSTENSRSFDCEAMEREAANWGEMQYVIETDKAQPKNHGKLYTEIPMCDRKPRLEYCPSSAHDMPYVKTFFSTLGYCRTAQDVEKRFNELVKYDGWKELGKNAFVIQPPQKQAPLPVGGIEKRLRLGDFACINGKYAQAKHIFEELAMEFDEDIRVFIGLVRVASKNFTVYAGKKIEQAIAAVDYLGGDNAKKTNQEYARYVEKRERLTEAEKKQNAYDDWSKQQRKQEKRTAKLQRKQEKKDFATKKVDAEKRKRIIWKAASILLLLAVCAIAFIYRENWFLIIVGLAFGLVELTWFLNPIHVDEFNNVKAYYFSLIFVWITAAVGLIVIFISRSACLISLPILAVKCGYGIYMLVKEYESVFLWLLESFTALTLVFAAIWGCCYWKFSEVSFYEGGKTISYNLTREYGTFVASPLKGATHLKKVRASNADILIVEEGITKLLKESICCGKIETLYLPSSLTTMENYCIDSSCPALKTVYIGYAPDGTRLEQTSQLTSITAKAISMSFVKTIYFNGTAEQWKIAIQTDTSWLDSLTSWLNAKPTIITNDGIYEN